ncbi:hypothetical protein [uncultured Fibrella sp.]|uniref:Ig-like domain-containing protein n=1 Tax=uncultured Fibrella sp. TaxID=1284596 RepID=UPI0035CC4C9C
MTSSIPTPICQDGSVSLKFNVNDNRSYDNKYNIRIYPATYSPVPSSTEEYEKSTYVYYDVGSFVSTSGGRNYRSADFKIPPSLAAGQYKIYITCQLSFANASFTNVFTVNATPKAVISGGGSVLYGQNVAVRLTFTGGGSQWSFKYNTASTTSGSFATVTNTTQNPYTINIPATQNYNYDDYDIDAFKNNLCSAGDVSGSAYITVSPLTVTPSSLNNATICPGRDAVSVSFGVNGTPPGGTSYSVELSDINGSFQNPLVIGTGTSSPINCPATPMASLGPGPGYKIRVIPTNNTFAVQASAATLSINLSRSALPVTPDITYCEGSPQPLQASGSNIFWYGISTNGGAYEGYNKAATPDSPKSPGTYRYQVTQTVNSCQSALGILTVTVKPKSRQPVVNQNITYCQNQGADQLSTADGPNLIWYDASRNSLGSTAPRPNTGSAGQQKFFVSRDDTGCRSDLTEITVNVTALPQAPGVSNPGAVCQYKDAPTLSANGQNLRWYRQESGGSSEGPIKPGSGNSGTTAFWVSQVVNNCEGPRAKIEQTINPASPDPGVASPLQLCQRQTAPTLTAQAQNPRWYDGGSTFISTDGPRPPTDQVRDITYKVSQTSNGCESKLVDLVVQIRETPGPPGVADINVCNNASAPTLTAQGSNVLWYTAETGGTGAGNPPGISTAQVGDQSYWVSQRFGSCEGPRAKLQVRVIALPQAPGVTNPAAICQYKDVPVLAANGQNLRWYRQETGGNSEGAIKPVSDSDGKTSFWVSQVVNNCEGPRAKIEQTINPASPDPTTATLLLCRDQPAPALTAGGQNLRWYDAGNTFISTNAPKPPTDQVRDITYKVSQTSNGCESKLVSLLVQVRNTPGAPGVADINVCNKATAPTLTAQGSSMLWYTAETGGTGAENAPIVSTTLAGDQTYWVSQRFGTCEGPRAKLTVHVIALPAEPTVSTPPPICQYVDVPVLTAQGQNLRWYRQETGGTAENQIKPLNDPAGKVSFWVSQFVNNCEGPRAKIEQTINPASPDPTTATLLLCRDQPAPALTAGGQNLRWYDAGNTFISTNAPKPPTDQVRDITYKVSQNSNGCESKLIALLVQVRNTPGAPGVSPISLCQNQVAQPLTATGVGLAWYDQATGGTSTSGLTPQTATLGERTYWVAQRFGTCEGPRAALVTTVYAVPAAPVASDRTFCINDTPTALTAVGQNLRWYDGSGTAKSSITPSTSTGQVLSYSVTQTQNGCESAGKTVTVRVLNRATVRLTGDSTVVLYDSTAIRLRFGGEPPWRVRLWDGKTVTTSVSPLVKWEKPTKPGTVTYEVQALDNDCGTGQILNKYQLIVLAPLAIEPLPTADLGLQVYPIPASQEITVEWMAPVGTVATLQLVNATGQVSWQRERRGTGNRETELVDLSKQNAGLLIMNLLRDNYPAKSIKLIKL